ncbi:hypothetical protein AKJ43_02380 [candidate division MSBL1 archaeon SCGC-AAA261D19]|uniref:6-pyruvoyl tetrahydrobiopterin synthase n=1 Tax=candidate division MSBL1 archaeon SCGC-AAA261D19 TaxID=1698273 RepID=A0A133V6S2_9EURY|nr:hypothetical protein AKJ43_02380 [candidate division MSBL1 archaeon SCGC-AAA261D19]
MKIGVEGFTFDSAHYTEGITEKCMNLHGHTFSVSVEVEGRLDEESGMVSDFGTIKDAVRNTLREWDHKFLVPKREAKNIEGAGPFNLEIKIIEGKAATTENIALNLAKEIHERLGFPVKVKVYEGERSYAVGEWP